MKKFSADVLVNVRCDVEVEAESIEEAKNLITSMSLKDLTETTVCYKIDNVEIFELEEKEMRCLN